MRGFWLRQNTAPPFQIWLFPRKEKQLPDIPQSQVREPTGPRHRNTDHALPSLSNSEELRRIAPTTALGLIDHISLDSETRPGFTPAFEL